MNYYDRIDMASHSSCKAIKLGYHYKPSPDVFRGGKIVHALLEGLPAPDADPVHIKLATALYLATQPIIAGYAYRVEWEIYRFLKRYGKYEAWEKAKLDLLVPGTLVLDYKTTTLTTEAAFIARCKDPNYGYFEQMARYMHMARVPMGYIVAVSSVNLMVFVIKLHQKHELYKWAFQQYQESNQKFLHHHYEA